MADITVAKPFYSVLILAFACSALVAGAAVGLRPLQEANRQLDRQKHILHAAGLYEENRPVAELFANIDTRVVELASGRFVETGTIDPATYNQRRAALSDELGEVIARQDDLAGLSRKEKYALVYMVTKDGRLDQVVLPVRGKGLWSTMYAYVAVAADLTTINGVSFYEHGETPGLGGEVENRRWQDGWRGKEIYRNGIVALQVTKGGGDSAGQEGAYRIDGLSGATLTSKGVDNLLHFWFSDHGFQPFFTELKASMAQEGSNG